MINVAVIDDEMEILSEFIFTDDMEDKIMLELMNEAESSEFLSEEESLRIIKNL